MERTFLNIKRWLSKGYSRIINYARSKGFPPRRIRRIGRLAAITGVLCILAIIGSLIAMPSFVAWLSGEREVFSSAENQGIWFMEFLILVFASIILHFALRERGTPAPSIVFKEFGMYQSKKDQTLFFSLKFKNDGETSGTHCIASLVIDGIEKKFDLASKPRTLLTDLNEAESGLEVNLCWELSKKKKITLLSDDIAELFVARWVPSRNRKSARFEIVGEDGYLSTSVHLNPSRYYGKVKVVSSNGKAHYKRFVLNDVSQTTGGPIIEQEPF